MRSIGYITLSTLILTGCVHSTRHDTDQIITKNYVHRYGIEVTPEDWKARGGNGQIVTRQRDGVVVTQSYMQGKLHGPTTYSYPHSDLAERTEVYAEGKRVKEIKHYPSGLPREEIALISDTEKTISSWHESGAPAMKERYEAEKLVEGEYYGPNEQLEARVENGFGERVVRDSFGSVVAKDAIQEGEMVTQTTFHPNRSPKEVTPYLHAVINGQRCTFLPDGEPNSVEEWQNGVQHGLTTLYQNGEKIAEIPYVSGVKEGIERRYSGGSQVVEEITWVAGTKQGAYHTYLGSKVQTDWYHQGKQVNKATYDTLSRPMNRIPS